MKKLPIRFAAVLLTVFTMAHSASAAKLLIPAGQVVGLELKENRVIIQGFDTLGLAAKEAGLKAGDQIAQIDGKAIHTPEDVRKALDVSDGDVELLIIRDGRTRELELEPAITEDGPKLGVFLQQGITGVGTVTFYDPESHAFGALGHGVNDKNGDLVVMTEGFAYAAQVDTIKKGKSGDPGQLMGSITDKTPIGELSKNTVQGVFGKSRLPFSGDSLPTGTPTDIVPGAATIRSNIYGTAVQEYSVEILKIYPNSGCDGRNLLLKVTDPRLLATTGGIVQGMSGSPIIQNGKLVGAVTHVLVNDPTTGYGIFIENMLDAAG
jgi:stage IV sporulation protein B